MLQDFLKPRLVGGRFEEHTLPLDVLKDWVAFEELVVEVAKNLYLRENPDRKRTPRGFADDFNLHLSDVEAGSVIPVLKRWTAGDKLPFADHFDRALALVQSVIVAVNVGQPVPEDFPRDYLGYFNRFGSALREGERIEWTAPGGSLPTIYDRTTRKKLVLTGATSYQVAADLRGWITEVDAEKHSYTIKLISGPKIWGRYPRELASSVLDALREFQEGKFQSSKVLVRGLADYDPNDQPVRVAETQHLQLLDPNDVAARCEELSQLKDGWLDGEGTAPTKEGLKSFMAAWDGAGTEAMPLPHIYPTPEGGIQMEWRQGHWELSAEVDLATLDAELLAVNVVTRACKDAAASLSAPEGWSKVTAFVTNPDSPVR
jgi:hypothetical protein